jgi:hypothetical protein
MYLMSYGVRCFELRVMQFLVIIPELCLSLMSELVMSEPK